MVETVLNTVASWQPEIGTLVALVCKLAVGVYFIAAGCACVHILVEED